MTKAGRDLISTYMLELLSASEGKYLAFEAAFHKILVNNKSIEKRLSEIEKEISHINDFITENLPR